MSPQALPALRRLEIEQEAPGRRIMAGFSVLKTLGPSD